MIALYSSAFSSYAPNLFSITGSEITDAHIYSSAIIILASAINYYSIKVVEQIESYAVIIKLVIFVAYKGFELIANAAPDIINPNKNIPQSLLL